MSSGRATSILRVGFSLAILALLLWKVDVVSVAGELSRVHPLTFALAVLVYLFSQVLSALRWWGLSRAVGFQASLGFCIRVYFVGMFFGTVTPSTIGADATRTVYLGRQPPGRAIALSTVVFDRVVGIVTLVAFAVLTMLFGPSESLPDGLERSTVLLGIGLIVAWALAPLAVRLLPVDSRPRRIVEEDLTPYFRDVRVLGVAFVLSLTLHLVQAFAQALIARAGGVDVSFGFVSIYHPLVCLAAAAPFTFGGFGTREASYVYLLSFAGIGHDSAIALSLLWFMVGALGGLVGGAVFAVADLSSDPAIEPASPTLG